MLVVQERLRHARLDQVLSARGSSGGGRDEIEYCCCEKQRRATPVRTYVPTTLALASAHEASGKNEPYYPEGGESYERVQLKGRTKETYTLYSVDTP